MSDLRGGIDLGGTKIQTAVIDRAGEVKGEARHPTPTKGGPEAVAKAMAAAMSEAAKGAGIESSELAGVGVGSPGDVNEKAGTVSSARNLSDWEGTFELGKSLEGDLGAPVRLGNDVQVATEAEFHLGAGKGSGSLIGVFWGTGVGGGLILDGERWLGRGAAGEVGHVVVHQDGARCSCGRRGCMEAYAGRMSMEHRARKRHDKGEKTKLFKLMEERGRTRLTSGVWHKAVEEGDDLATELLDDAVAALGTGIASIVNVLDVGTIVLGGGMGVRFGEPVAQRIRDAMLPHLFSDDRPPTLEVAALGDLGGAIGAALLVRDPAVV